MDRQSDGMFWIRCGALMGALAVVCGAIGAHALKDVLLDKYAGVTKEVMGRTIPAAEKYLKDFKTAAEYQMTHALALLGVGLLSSRFTPRTISLAGWSFLLGTILFSGSLYALALSGITQLGMITPIGGVLLIIGWGVLLFGGINKPQEHV